MGDEGQTKRTVNLFHKFQKHNRSQADEGYVDPSLQQRDREQQRVKFDLVKYLIFISNGICWVSTWN